MGQVEWPRVGGQWSEKIEIWQFLRSAERRRNSPITPLEMVSFTFRSRVKRDRNVGGTSSEIGMRKRTVLQKRVGIEYGGNNLPPLAAGNGRVTLL